MINQKEIISHFYRQTESYQHLAGSIDRRAAPELVKAHLNVDDKFIANLPKDEPLVR
jgi:hypothetical protein